jgi:hypothetical protein
MSEIVSVYDTLYSLLGRFTILTYTQTGWTVEMDEQLIDVLNRISERNTAIGVAGIDGSARKDLGGKILAANPSSLELPPEILSQYQCPAIEHVGKCSICCSYVIPSRVDYYSLAFNVGIDRLRARFSLLRELNRRLVLLLPFLDLRLAGSAGLSTSTCSWSIANRYSALSGRVLWEV